MLLSCTISEISSVISENLKRSRDPGRCLSDPVFSQFQFGTIPACDGWTDRQTDRAIAYRASIVSHGNYYFTLSV